MLLQEKTYDKGIGFGGRIPYFRLYLDEELASGSCLDFCTTFEKGSLAASEKFDIESLEV